MIMLDSPRLLLLLFIWSFAGWVEVSILRHYQGKEGRKSTEERKKVNQGKEGRSP